MRWISKTEKEIIIEWSKACGNDSITDEYFSKIDDNMSSYWDEYDDDDNLVEYDFSTIPQLKEMLQGKMKDDFYQDIILPIAIATFKEKHVESNDIIKRGSQSDSVYNDELEIPDFVYVF